MKSILLIYDDHIKKMLNRAKETHEKKIKEEISWKDFVFLKCMREK